MAPSVAVLAAHTFGSVLRSRDLGGLCVEEVLMPPRLAVPEHAHEGAQIYFLLEGRYAETARGRRHELAPGAAWYRPPREPHRNEVLGGETALTLIVTVEEGRLRSVERRTPQPRALRSLLLDEVRGELLREIRGGDEAAATALEGWALLLLSRTQRLLAGAPPAAPEWLGDAVHHLATSYLEPLSLASLAAHVGIHPATLAAAFRRWHGTSVGDYVRELRLLHARREVLGSRKPLKRIAVEAGFFDQAHLGRWFRRRFGVSPGACRAAASPRVAPRRGSAPAVPSPSAGNAVPR
jgi:AraC family transcriptional regulator